MSFILLAGVLNSKDNSKDIKSYGYLYSIKQKKHFQKATNYKTLKKVVRKSNEVTLKLLNNNNQKKLRTNLEKRGFDISKTNNN